MILHRVMFRLKTDHREQARLTVKIQFAVEEAEAELEVFLLWATMLQ